MGRRLEAEERSERVWLEMTALDTSADAWEDVQEHLLHKPHEHNHRLRRWKFFGK